MAFKTKSEKRAFRIGLLRGLLGKKKVTRSKTKSGSYKRSKHNKTLKKRPYKSPPAGAYNSRGRLRNENLVDDLHGLVVFWDGDDRLSF